jgi:transposase
LNAESTILSFKKIEATYPIKTQIHLFCDNARYYRNKKVQEYLKTSKIKLNFLPPYSPNLNPIERLWKWMKQRVILNAYAFREFPGFSHGENVKYNTYYQEFDDFKSAIYGFFTALLSPDPESILGRCFASCIRDKFRPGAPSAIFEITCVCNIICLLKQ